MVQNSSENTLHPEQSGSMDLRNVGILPQHYTASQSRKPGHERLKTHSKPIGMEYAEFPKEPFSILQRQSHYGHHTAKSENCFSLRVVDA
jgi:hypothetical protein